MLYTQMPKDIRQKLQLNVGILVTSFDPLTGEVGEILGATSGGINFSATPTYTDLFEDVDNNPGKSKEGTLLDNWEVSLSGVYSSVDSKRVKSLIAAADVDPENPEKITPRNYVVDDDFEDVWWVGDYSDVNTGESAGFMAVHVMNALSQDGFQIQTQHKGKGKFSFNYGGYYSTEDIDKVPFEVYMRSGSTSGETDETAA